MLLSDNTNQIFVCKLNSIKHKMVGQNYLNQLSGNALYIISYMIINVNESIQIVLLNR